MATITNDTELTPARIKAMSRAERIDAMSRLRAADPPVPLRAIGQLFGMSAERVRQLTPKPVRRPSPPPPPDGATGEPIRLVLRLPVGLHEQVTVTARENGVSANTLMIALLAGALGWSPSENDG